MRTIDVSEVTALVRKLCIDANYYLPADLRQAFVDGQQSEQSPLGREIFGEMIANCDLARENNVPVCQDTGMAIVFAEIGQDVHLTGGSFEDAVTEGVRRGYIDGYLRLSVVGDPLRRENTNDNTPCILYTSMVPGDRVKITVAPKGFGSDEDVHPGGNAGADHRLYRGRLHRRRLQPLSADRDRRRPRRHERQGGLSRQASAAAHRGRA